MQEIVDGIGWAAVLPDADALLAHIEREVEASPELVIGADAATVATSRMTGWYGDPDAFYTYSGIMRHPQAWPPALAALRDRLNGDLAIALNSCLVGIYSDGESDVDWHADDEPELRDRIVSVSLGAPRTFMLRNGSGFERSVVLEHGSVLVMTVASQRIWQHRVPREPGAARRINLTYRVIAQR